MSPSFTDLEPAVWQAVSRADRAFLSATMAPDFFELGRSGRRYSRDDILSGMDQQPGVVTVLHDIDTHMLSPQIALVTYVSEVRYDRGTEWANRSSLWDRSSGEWRLRFHQGTPIEPLQKAPA
ncbi:DUF4440 domain-containing protein [Paracoccus pacificus]|uniref:DUF4440 domain-containing protein n=1 Tax=Paracoccus pacificus TaxID=1463598 RepID=A0ABW4R7B9_9RHOB